MLKTSLLLMLALGIASGETILNYFGPGDSFGPFVGYQIGGGYLRPGGVELAVEFIPKIDAVLTQLRTAVFNTSGTKGKNDLVVDLTHGVLPGSPIETFATTVATGGGGAIYAFNSSRHPTLFAGHPYWIVLSSNDLMDNFFGWNISGVGPYALLAERSPGYTLWETFYNAAPVFDVSGEAVSTAITPEPRTILLVSSALIFGILLCRGISWNVKRRSIVGDALQLP